jgi:hypothetical protein
MHWMYFLTSQIRGENYRSGSFSRYRALCSGSIRDMLNAVPKPLRARFATWVFGTTPDLGV